MLQPTSRSFFLCTVPYFFSSDLKLTHMHALLAVFILHASALYTLWHQRECMIGLLYPFQCSYNSTLEQTIQYMKSLQQQNQALTGGPSPPAAAAMNPVVQQPLYVPPGPPATLAPTVVLGPPPMVPLVPKLTLPHYHYPAPTMVMMVAAPRPLYQTTPTPRFAPTACSPARGSRSSMRGKSKRS
jgi:hypothetical protein